MGTGTGMEMGTGTGTGTDIANANGNRNGQCQTDMSTVMDSVRWMCRTARRTASDGRVEQRDRQCQMDVSDREMDSIRWTC